MKLMRPYWNNATYFHCCKYHHQRKKNHLIFGIAVIDKICFQLFYNVYTIDTVRMECLMYLTYAPLLDLSISCCNLEGSHSPVWSMSFFGNNDIDSIHLLPPEWICNSLWKHMNWLFCFHFEWIKSLSPTYNPCIGSLKNMFLICHFELTCCSIWTS